MDSLQLARNAAINASTLADESFKTVCLSSLNYNFSQMYIIYYLYCNLLNKKQNLIFQLFQIKISVK